jgi:hypothetical protein
VTFSYHLTWGISLFHSGEVLLMFECTQVNIPGTTFYAHILLVIKHDPSSLLIYSTDNFLSGSWQTQFQAVSESDLLAVVLFRFITSLCLYFVCKAWWIFCKLFKQKELSFLLIITCIAYFNFPLGCWSLLPVFAIATFELFYHNFVLPLSLEFEFKLLFEVLVYLEHNYETVKLCDLK